MSSAPQREMLQGSEQKDMTLQILVVGWFFRDLPSLKLTFSHLKMMVSKSGISFSRGVFSGAILVSRRVFIP